MALVAEQLVASSESSGFPSFIFLKQEQGRASIRAGDLTTNYSIFFWSGRDFNPCGSHSASKYRPGWNVGKQISSSGLRISHLLLPQEMGFCVHWH